MYDIILVIFEIVLSTLFLDKYVDSGCDCPKINTNILLQKKFGRIQFNVQIEVPSYYYYYYYVNFKNKRNREKGISVIWPSPHSVATIYTPELQKLGIKSPKFLRPQGSRRTNVHRERTFHNTNPKISYSVATNP